MDPACDRSRRKQTMEMLAEGFTGKTEEVFGSGFSLAPAPAGPETPMLAELRAKAERAQPKPTEKNQLYASFGRKLEAAPPPTAEQLAAAQERREAAARHQEVAFLPSVSCGLVIEPLPIMASLHLCQTIQWRCHKIISWMALCRES